MHPILALLPVVIFTVTSLTVPSTGWTQSGVTGKRGTQETGHRGPTQSATVPDQIMPPEIGKIFESSEEARQSGNYTVHYLRRVANTAYDWLLHLRISVVENDPHDIQYDTQNCRLLYELIQESNPSFLLLQDIKELRDAVAEAGPSGPTAACLGLQLDIEKYGMLYPLVNLRAMIDAVMRHQRDGDENQIRLVLRRLEESVALPGLDGPISGSLESFEAALTYLEEGKSGPAREELKRAANLISLLNVSTFLCESKWYLAKADNALHSGWYEIALASMKTADDRLDSAEDRSWDEFATTISKIREDLGRLIALTADRKGKTSLTPDQLQAVVKRIDSELQITY